MNNLAIAFPEKTEADREQIAKEFYQNLIDNFIETIKLLSISKKQLDKRFTNDFSVLNNFYSTGKNAQIHLGHFFNWEFANLSASSHSLFTVLVVYMPILNKAVDKIFYKLRTRFGAKMIAATAFGKDLRPYSKERFCLVFVADQNAGNPDISYWSKFFGKIVPFVKGPEKSARINNAGVFLAKIYKIKRGHYHWSLELLTDAPRNLKEGEITKKMIAYIENAIREHPSNYLWSHRRWKHELNPEKHSSLII
jgi:KDO2-lipid IV(A) lauroyltransferase